MCSGSRTIINNQGRSGRSRSAVISIVLSIVGFISQFLERLGRSDRLYECQALFGNCKFHELYCWQIKRILFSELSIFLSHNSFYCRENWDLCSKKTSISECRGIYIQPITWTETSHLCQNYYLCVKINKKHFKIEFVHQQPSISI